MNNSADRRHALEDWCQCLFHIARIAKIALADFNLDTSFLKFLHNLAGNFSFRTTSGNKYQMACPIAWQPMGDIKPDSSRTASDDVRSIGTEGILKFACRFDLLIKAVSTYRLWLSITNQPPPKKKGGGRAEIPSPYHHSAFE